MTIYFSGSSLDFLQFGDLLLWLSYPSISRVPADIPLSTGHTLAIQEAM